ncbi:flagellar biosynthesis protein FliS [Vibrio ponticus]|nr:flagellar biosynthesis protein FliS [Vibrio ponticus]
MRGSLQAYKKVSVDSQLSAASPHKIVQMLMAGAIERLIQGKAAMQQGNIQQKGSAWVKHWTSLSAYVAVFRWMMAVISLKILINCTNS